MKNTLLSLNNAFDSYKVKELHALFSDLGTRMSAIRKKKSFNIDLKNDASPVTEADFLANTEIIEFLNKHFKDIPIVSEEMKEMPYSQRKDWKKLWLLDPLDGTKEYIKGQNDYSINLALIEDTRPVFGVVYFPEIETLYFALEEQGAYVYTKGLLKKMTPQKNTSDSYRVAVSRSHLNQETKDYLVWLEASKKERVEVLPMGSALKMCKVAESVIDEYPRLGPTMEWDTAASQIICQEAGKKLLNFETRKALVYNKENLLNPMFIAI